MSCNLPTMTVEEFAALPGVTVSPAQAAAVLGCDRYALNIAAHLGTLELDYFFSGRRLKISKNSVLRFIAGMPKEKQPQEMLFCKGVSDGVKEEMMLARSMEQRFR